MVSSVNKDRVYLSVIGCSWTNLDLLSKDKSRTSLGGRMNSPLNNHMGERRPEDVSPILQLPHFKEVDASDY